MDTAVLVAMPDGHGLSTRRSADGFSGDVHRHLARCTNTRLLQQFAALAMHDNLPFEFESHLNRDDNKPYNNSITNNFDNRKNITKCPCCIGYEDKDNLCDICSSKNGVVFNPCCCQECTLLDNVHRCCWEEKERVSPCSLHNHSVHGTEEPNEHVSAQVENGYLITSPQILIDEASQSHMQHLDQINISYLKHSYDDVKQSDGPLKEQNACPEIITCNKNVIKQLENNKSPTAEYEKDIHTESGSHFENQQYLNTNANRCLVCSCAYCGEELQNCLEFADLTEDDCGIDPCEKESICEVPSCPYITKPRRQACSCGRKLRKKMKAPTRLTCRGKKKVRWAVDESNHKLPFLSRRKKWKQDLLRVIDENFSLSTMNYELRNSIRHERECTISDCVRILDSIISFCERKSQKTCTKTRRKLCPPKDDNREDDGCSGGNGMCGGYTPSGWNKLLTKHSVECTDRCCLYCCPPCPPCPNCTPCTCAIAAICPNPSPRSRSPSPCARPKSKKKITSSAKNASNSSTSFEENKCSSCIPRPSTKILGELAFQLERRILDYVFGLEDSKRRRFYGYTVSNICEMMEKECKQTSGTLDPFVKTDMASRLKKVLAALQTRGYNIKVHSEFAQETVNKYGLLASPPDPLTIEDFGLQDPACIAGLIFQLGTGPAEIKNLTVLLDSLTYLSKCDGRPLFVW